MNAVAGFTAMDWSVADVIAAAADPETEPRFARLAAVTVIDPAVVPLTTPLLTEAAPEPPRTDHLTMLVRS
jgi:hypothetical protein